MLLALFIAINHVAYTFGQRILMCTLSSLSGAVRCWRWTRVLAAFAGLLRRLLAGMAGQYVGNLLISLNRFTATVFPVLHTNVLRSWCQNFQLWTTRNIRIELGLQWLAGCSYIFYIPFKKYYMVQEQGVWNFIEFDASFGTFIFYHMAVAIWGGASTVALVFNSLTMLELRKFTVSRNDVDILFHVERAIHEDRQAGSASRHLRRPLLSLLYREDSTVSKSSDHGGVPIASSVLRDRRRRGLSYPAYSLRECSSRQILVLPRQRLPHSARCISSAVLLQAGLSLCLEHFPDQRDSEGPRGAVE